MVIIYLNRKEFLYERNKAAKKAIDHIYHIGGRCDDPSQQHDHAVAQTGADHGDGLQHFYHYDRE
jgi:hypothetical protein